MIKYIMFYHTETIRASLGNGQSDFTQEIDVPFEVDEITLKYVNKLDNDYVAADFINLIYSDLVRNDILFSIPNSEVFYQTVDIPLNNIKKVRGTYTFRVRDINGQIPRNIATMNMYLSFVIIFKKY